MPKGSDPQELGSDNMPKGSDSQELGSCNMPKGSDLQELGSGMLQMEKSDLYPKTI